MKIPVLNKTVDHIDITKNGETLLRLKDEDVHGKKWGELQEIIGDKLGNGTFGYSLKWKNEDKPINGRVRAVVVRKETKNNLNDDRIINMIKELDDKISSKTKGDVTTSIVTDMIKESAELRITYLKEKIIDLEKIREKLEKENEELDAENDELDSKLKELIAQNTGTNKIIEAVKFLTQLKGQRKEPLQDLTASVPDDIPPNIIQIIGMVDFSTMNPEQIREMENLLRIWIQQLPLKQQKV